MHAKRRYSAYKFLTSTTWAENRSNKLKTVRMRRKNKKRQKKRGQTY
jgi:hypothetical protein